MNSISIKEINPDFIIPLKIILSVKICLLLLICSVAQVFGSATYSQSTTLSLKLKNVSIEEVLNHIEEQSEYRFLYNKKLVNVDRIVSVDVTKKNVTQILNELFKDEDVSYTISNRQIVLSKSNENPGTQQDRVITGSVRDNKGEPLLGVSIAIKGTSKGTVTDANGNFSMQVPSTESILAFSYLGYVGQEIKVDTRTDWHIILSEDVQLLDEVVVVGYETMKKENLTGAVAQIKGDVLKNRQVTNVGQALQGEVGNLYITTIGDPGGVGTPSSFNIRGYTSLNGGGPLFVVDGIPVSSIDNLNPTDIESISILKDAASSAIYGARAAYGVILVTTKKGSSGKTTVNYSGLFAGNTPTYMPETANSLEFAQTYNASARNSGLVDPFSEEYLERIRKYMQDPNSIPVTTPNPSDPTIWGFENANANVDWYKEYFKSTAFSQKHDLNVTGGNKAITYYMGLGYYDQDGILRYGDDNFKRVNVTGNLHAEPLDWLRFDFRTRFARGKIDNPYPYSYNNGNWFHLAASRQPVWPVKNPDGKFSMISCVPTFNAGGRSINISNDLWLTGAMEAEPVKDWKINADFTYNIQNNKNSEHEAKIYAYKVDGAKYAINDVNSISESMVQNNYYSFNAYTSYFKQLNKHYFKALIGQQVELAQYYTLSGVRRDLITDEIPSMGVATGNQNAYDAMSEWSTLGTFMRLNYNYGEKYLIEFNARYDGTSKFPKGDRFDFFPSVSVGYNIAKEDFWKLENTISELKLRASYGSLGNQSVNNYMFYATIPIYSRLGYLLNNTRPNYLGAPGLISSDLTWETSRTIDVGLDATLLNNRLNVTFDWYSRSTLNMLGPAEALPAVLGAGVPQTNNADLRTNGFELTIGWRQRVNNDFQYNVSAVLSDYLSKVTRYNNPTGILSTYYEGQTIGEYWGYETNGLIQTQEQLDKMADQSLFYGTWNTGDVSYKDQNGDNIINYGKNTINDHGDLKIIGNNTPRFAFGVNAGLNWKDFDLSMFLQGVAKRDLWVGGTYFYGLTGGYGSSVWKSTLDYWTEDHRDAYWPRPYHTNEVNKNRQVTDQYMQNAAYLRLKNLQVGYSIPEHILKRYKIQRLRIFFSGENLFTFTKIHENFDPEAAVGSWGSGKIYPLMKTVSAGINLEF